MEKNLRTEINRYGFLIGHTHNPLKKAISTNDVDGGFTEHIYLNTGTWRKRYHECLDGSGFIGWKDITYIILYTPDEKSNIHKSPVFETWTGSLKREN